MVQDFVEMSSDRSDFNAVLYFCGTNVRRSDSTPIPVECYTPASKSGNSKK